MPRVRMLSSYAGRTFSYNYQEEADLPVADARKLVCLGVAEYVTSEPVQTPERRQRPVETRRGPGRPRKNPA